MYCRKCGGIVQEDWKICPCCGNPLKEDGLQNELQSKEKIVKSEKRMKRKKPIYKRVWFWILIVFVALGVSVFGTEEDGEHGGDEDSDFTPSTREQIFSTGQKSAIDRINDAASYWTNGAFGSSESDRSWVVYDEDGVAHQIETDSEGNAIIDEDGNYIEKGSRFICQLGEYVCTNKDYSSASIYLYSEDGEAIKYALYDSNLSADALITGDVIINDRNILRINIEDYQMELLWSDETTMYIISRGKLGGTYADVIKDMTKERDYKLNED